VHRTRPQLGWGHWCGGPGQQIERSCKMDSKMNGLNENVLLFALNEF